MTDIFSLKDFSFPKGFLWGSATAGHQIEGNNIHSSSWNTEQEWLKKDPKAEVSGMACNHYNMVEEDVDLIKAWDIRRFVLAWSGRGYNRKREYSIKKRPSIMSESLRF